MADFGKFTYPFCYVPHPAVADAARRLIEQLGAKGSPASLEDGKMLGVLITDKGPLYAFSGLLGGKAVVDGFVPPILDITDPEGYFKKREAEISAMPDGAQKARASAQLQEWLFSNYLVHNALGEELSIADVFAQRGLVPPGGTGECAAPKLLEFAYRNGLKPLAIGEFWFGKSPSAEVREHGRFYPSCTGKCGPLLSWMMQGLDVEQNPLDTGFAGSTQPRILFEDQSIIIGVPPTFAPKVTITTENSRHTAPKVTIRLSELPIGLGR